ncbi:DUF4338 domain-containing protein [Aneurinibacillus aneurinilyticus]|uniref:Druantia anti-phage system protein DruA n=1 Tax=Aneurinibacillus aneurinilyticus TaxID=1391 RepID=UPI002E1DA5AE|nr:DUF4338 domain-containing protein [Aneurinibacillus aneurinilyticus]
MATNNELKNKSISIDEDFTLFDPKLPTPHYSTFLNLVDKVKSELPAKRVGIIDDYINSLNFTNDIEDLKLRTVLSVLRDLLVQEWRIKLNFNGKVLLAPSELVNTSNKLYLRQQLQIERNAQLQKDSIKKFIKRMEKTKKYNNHLISIKNLIGDPNVILNRINNNEDIFNIVEPYIQIVSKERCGLTGYKLSEIWRYFRYTWSIPYKSTPGRNIFYLIRDAAQPFHPIIGISALGNSVLQLTNRDNYIGWTLRSIKENIKQKEQEISYEECLKGCSHKSRKITKKIALESKTEYRQRIDEYSNCVISRLSYFINQALSEVYYSDLLTPQQVEKPDPETLKHIERTLELIKNKQLNNKRSNSNSTLLEDAQSPLFTKKRANELHKLLEAKFQFQAICEQYDNPTDTLKKLVNFKGGKIINIALQANRKRKIGSNMMEIIVCGAIPPYNELLGGKLVSMLTTSPTVISDYNKRYSNQVSEIASRMNAAPVIRDSRLAFLGTTSLYHSGSSQYNRIKIPAKYGEIVYKKIGDTEGFGSVFFSDKTTELINDMLITIDGGRKINNVFGEGTSPRMRLMRSGLSVLGISENFIKHHTKRIIYGIELASNTKEFLNGTDEELNYFYPLDGNEELYTEEIIDYWKTRWLLPRLTRQSTMEKLSNFNANSILVSNYV